jgi:hypothetical protein
MLTLPNFWHFVAQVSRRFLRETWGFFARHLAAAGPSRWRAGLNVAPGPSARQPFPCLYGARTKAVHGPTHLCRKNAVMPTAFFGLDNASNWLLISSLTLLPQARRGGGRGVPRRSD